MGNRKQQFSGAFPRISWRIVLAYSSIFVAVPILTFFIGRYLDRIFLLPAFPPFPANMIAGMSIFIFGLAIGIKSTRQLYKIGRGLPWGGASKQAQSTRLVTDGLYACCRNPMTFGYSLLPCGMGIILKSLAMTFFIPAIVFSVMIVWLKVLEEPGLERRFGEAYREYKSRTPFLIPRPKPLIIELIYPISTALKTRQAEDLKSDKRKNN